MKYWNLRNVLRTSSFESQVNYASTKVQKNQIKDKNETSQPVPVPSSAMRSLFSPVLPRSTLETLRDITGVVVGYNHISWAKISVDGSSILDWDAHRMPDGFTAITIESDIIVTANAIMSKIPPSDLYIMESRSYRWMNIPNYLCLRSMLVLLLNSLNYDEMNPKVVFQKPKVLNNLYSLTVGGERTSVEVVLQKSFHQSSEDKVTEVSHVNKKDDSFSNIIQSKLLCPTNNSRIKRESLCFALLLAHSFLDVAIRENPESLSKIRKKLPPSVL